MHCAPMCGPFVLGQVSDRLARIPAARLCESARLSSALLLPYHLGRLSTYAALGMLAATSGDILASAAPLGMLPALLLLLGALLFLGHAAGRLVPRLRPLIPASDRAPAAWVRGIARLTSGIDRTRPLGGYLLGVALGFLPCGFLYAALAAAAAAGNAAGGALAMLAFGVGTVPSLLAVGIAGQAAGYAWRRGITAAAPVVMLLNAIILGVLAWQRFAALA
ncbi:sulfite exporter TauE/SafE family protein [Rhodovastum atsumiense]|uniref:Sulfite exporter TauE/SafE family protein n=2 Tax=Rhodovastum atsumiense TaxID=504468 RepID=A0A5M6J2E2_9PROT|nr:sulfite exporter TauE/SafE family protein [Rhodovastum atsumiense]